ncbi:hypothetical protein GCM10007913_18070 [Devosia yakushimensis]|uniref:Uncharacterized protein n=1 Tax=Devosia yakushimensis TaxID=470028 RepID=A0ABQ5UDR8_9HYPH|nr:hypothetical protein [Devosia yakushimensis]GLQ09875.1 hypothetical protein GCM10007913_18070 [Devosia yakushimensis]
MMRESAHIVVERNTTWEGEAASEPYEVGWAKEAILFVQVLAPAEHQYPAQVRVQLSPDGIHWCDEGTRFDLPSSPGDVVCARVAHFGGWLRLAVSMKKSVSTRVLVSLHLKG